MLNSYEALNFLRNGTMNLWNFYATNYFIRFVRKAKVSQLKMLHFYSCYKSWQNCWKLVYHKKWFLQSIKNGITLIWPYLPHIKQEMVKLKSEEKNIVWLWNNVIRGDVWRETYIWLVTATLICNQSDCSWGWCNLYLLKCLRGSFFDTFGIKRVIFKIRE